MYTGCHPTYCTFKMKCNGLRLTWRDSHIRWHGQDLHLPLYRLHWCPTRLNVGSTSILPLYLLSHWGHILHWGFMLLLCWWYSTHPLISMFVQKPQHVSGTSCHIWQPVSWNEIPAKLSVNPFRCIHMSKSSNLAWQLLVLDHQLPFLFYSVFLLYNIRIIWTFQFTDAIQVYVLSLVSNYLLLTGLPLCIIQLL